MRLKRQWVMGIVVLFLLGLAAGCAGQQEKAPAQSEAPKVKDVILATTTSTVDTGLLEVLIPKFEEKTGYKVKPIGVGSGQAIEMGKKGEADVLLTHAPKSEKELVDAGTVTNYKLVMHNDFVIVGPAEDPAGIKGEKSAAEAFKKIAQKGAAFVSRGDDSGTHKKELDIWKNAGIEPGGSWYQESGTGMGQTLLVASEKKGYTLADRGTYLAQQKNIELEVLVEGDKVLLNIYHVMQVNPQKFTKVNGDGAKAFVDFMVSPETQRIIADFGKDEYGQALFVPDAGKNEDEVGK
ncbi:MAG: extracellular solute-binding protein [Bacillota bacterium]|nr:extracellular solute-binding protein [Bacillota bacterium]